MESSKLRAMSRRLSGRTLILAGAVLLPLLTTSGPIALGWVPDRWLAVGILGAYLVILALGMTSIAGWCGQWILGYAAFFAIGAYTFAFLNSNRTDIHLGFLLTAPVAIGLGVLVGLVIGLPSLRIRGDYFAVLTLAFAGIVQAALANLTSVTGGNAGFVPIDSLSLLPGATSPEPSSLLERYAIGWLAVAIVWIAFDRLRHAPLGRLWVAVREDEEAARALGNDSLRTKLIALAYASAVAAFTGMLFASSQRSLAPATFDVALSFFVVTAVVVGGTGSSTGAVLGSIVLLAIPEVLRDIGGGRATLLDYQMMIYGAAMVAVVLWRPGGLIEERLEALEADGLEPPRQGGAGAHLLLANVSARYGGVQAVSGISMDVKSGEVVGIIGPNGSGKTTLLNVISGFHPLSSGTMTLDGVSVHGWSPDRRARAGMSRTFQMNRLFEGISNAENILIAADTNLAPAGVLDIFSRRGRDARSRARAREVLGLFPERFPLSRWVEQPRNLSYANRRRLEISRALAAQPRLLLLDEPTAGMNPVDRRELLSKVREWAEGGVTVLVVEHQLGALAEIADRLVAFDHGTVIATGTPKEVLESAEVLASLMSVEPG